MTRRPWVPIAAVLAVLLVGTLIAGSLLRNRLDDARVVLEPAIESVAAGEPRLDARCDGAAVDGPVDAFLDAVDQDELAGEVSVTAATFDSFLLRTAIARAGAGDHQLVVRAEPLDGAWCLAEAEFSTSE